MAERRMFAKTIVLSDAFLDMPLSTRCLYFTLGMVADDDGFVNNPKSIMRQCGAQEDDMKVLLAKNFLIPFESGVVVIKHWRINNYLQNDRKKETKYLEEMSTLTVKDNGAYHRNTSNSEMYTDTMYTESMYTQNSIDKYSLDKNSIDKNSMTADAEAVLEKWNELGFSGIRNIVPGSERERLLKARIKENGLDAVLEAIEKVKKSDFLHGQNKNGWTIFFDWFIKPRNFLKVLEGNYDNRSENDAGRSISRSPEESAKKWNIHYD